MALGHRRGHGRGGGEFAALPERGVLALTLVAMLLFLATLVVIVVGS